MYLKRLVKTACAALVALSMHGALATNLAGVEIRPYFQSRAGVLVPKSCGVKRTLIIDHYVSALYLPRNAPIEAVANTRAAKVVQIYITNDNFLPGNVPSKWRRALARAVSPQILASLDAMMKTLRQGDIVTITYLPLEGTSVYKNGEIVTRTPGHRCVDEILRAWAEDAPVSDKLEQLVAENPC